MKKVDYEHFSRFLMPHSVAARADELYFCVKRAVLDENRYASDLWVLRDGKAKRLTSAGDVSGFWLTDEGVVFSALREKKDKERAEAGEPLTVLYVLPYDGGEARELCHAVAQRSRLVLGEPRNLEALPRRGDGHARKAVRAQDGALIGLHVLDAHERHEHALLHKDAVVEVNVGRRDVVSPGGHLDARRDEQVAHAHQLDDARDEIDPEDVAAEVAHDRPGRDGEQRDAGDGNGVGGVPHAQHARVQAVRGQVAHGGSFGSRAPGHYRTDPPPAREFTCGPFCAPKRESPPLVNSRAGARVRASGVAAAKKRARWDRVPARGPLWLLPPGPDQVRGVASPEPAERARGTL